MVNIHGIEKVLTYPEYKDQRELFRHRALTELIRIYKKYKSREDDPFKWGDEIEYSLVKFDHEKKRAYVLLKAEEFFKSVDAGEVDKTDVTFNIEYTSYQIETTPSKPWNSSFSAFRQMQENLGKRRAIINNYYCKEKDEHVIALTSFPLIGRDGFKWPFNKDGKEDLEADGEKFQSIFENVYGAVFDHEYIKIYPINKNSRTGHKPMIYAPIYIDKNTPQPFIEDLSIYVKPEKKDQFQKFVRPNEIYMDHDIFGWGVSCLQVTFQTKSMEECGIIYDQLAALAPILLALSASTPTARGYLTDIDTRWPLLRQSNDCRTDEEKRLLPKTRFDDTECYLSDYGQKFNKKVLFRDDAVFKALVDEGINVGAANHYANMFLRDPLFVFEKNLNSDIEEEAKNFEFLQALNFKPIRHKTPPFEQDKEGVNNIGWRIEFRPLELQFTDYENTAFATIIILLAKTILKFGLDFLINLEEVDANMKTSEKRNACLKEKFHFRFGNVDKDFTEESKLLTINEIINGNPEGFKGIIPLINDYLDSEQQNVKEKDRVDINSYLKLFKKRAEGTLLTPASWMRKFIDEHPAYKHDSYINEEVNYDLIWTIFKIANGQQKCDDLLPEF